MSIPCVLIVDHNLLINQIAGNLIQKTGVAVVTSTAKNQQELIVDIDKFEPDILLMQQSSQFAQNETLTQLLQFYPQLAVAVLDEQYNHMQIYRMEDVIITVPMDVVNNLLRAKPSYFA